MPHIVTTNTSNNPIPPLDLTLHPVKSALLQYLWSHQFYKRLIGPLTNLSNNGITIAQALREEPYWHVVTVLIPCSQN